MGSQEAWEAAQTVRNSSGGGVPLPEQLAALQVAAQRVQRLQLAVREGKERMALYCEQRSEQVCALW